MHRSRWARLAAVVALVALLGAACDDDNKTVATDQAAENAGDAGGDGSGDHSPDADATDASGLRADLTALLQEHVYLAGIAISTGVASGLDSEAFTAAAGALGENTQGLADAIGAVYGEEAGDAFKGLWDTHIGFFVDYTKAAAADDAEARAKAVDDLGQYAKDFGAFLEGANPNLKADDVAAALAPHAESVFAAIDAAVAGDAGVFAKLREAASHMPDIAAVLSGAIAEQFPEKFAAADPPGLGQLRADLTGLLQEHVYLAGIAITTGLGAGLDSAEFTAAAGVLDANSQALAGAIGSVYGAQAGDAFKGLWDTHIGFFVDYTKAVAADDADGQSDAVEKLEQYAEDFGAFLEGANPNLPAAAVAEALGPHVATLTAAIDAAAGGETSVFSKLRAAAVHMPSIADTLAGAIAEQFPEKFA